MERIAISFYNLKNNIQKLVHFLLILTITPNYDIFVLTKFNDTEESRKETTSREAFLKFLQISTTGSYYSGELFT